MTETRTKANIDDMSRKDMCDLLMATYISNASHDMIANVMLKNSIHIPIPERHSDIAEKLATHWISKGYMVGRLFDKQYRHDSNGVALPDRISGITLTWNII